MEAREMKCVNCGRRLRDVNGLLLSDERVDAFGLGRPCPLTENGQHFPDDVSWKDIEVMVSQGYSDEEARKLDDIASGCLESCIAFGMSDYTLLRSIREAYDLGKARNESAKD